MVSPPRLLGGPRLHARPTRGVNAKRPATRGAGLYWEGHVPARRSTNRFHERELARALRAAQKSGTPFDRVDVDPATGKISVIISKPGDGGNAKTGNEVENWITKHENKR
jgi:hypothetical protein